MLFSVGRQRGAKFHASSICGLPHQSRVTTGQEDVAFDFQSSNNWPEQINYLRYEAYTGKFL
ncbi:hypothetical protein CHS0354_005094 [Potamilus streckersoni]|uniref:Uncharacterized protein n=1 Tax=Potamilus streckersoni TaxID=2493646 RepID=A0AAE0VWL2_9BIVA|nr:hypothetical protein CHS0354_005094 [Potamilus streckersoni]